MTTIYILALFLGTCALGLALAYGVIHTRRSRAERERTERATAELYRIEDRKERVEEGQASPIQPPDAERSSRTGSPPR